ncbi:MAG TPA: tetratricopeptide repeat protein [Gammaproteobacteria bacterium]|nr:tetratricopeptide repeat protein [Gammaproteobacteria bacterium]
MNGLIGKLLERRIPQYLVVYIGVAWGIMQFTQLIVDVFLFSPHWIKIVIFASAMLWPAYLVVVYRHGRPGADSWGLPEKIGIPVNLLLAFGALFVIFRGQDLGAATTSIKVADETGNVVERKIAKQEFRKRTVLFNFDGAGLTDDDLWLTGFIPDAVYIDMLGNDFFEPVGPDQFIEKLRRAGYPKLRNVPLALKREVANGLHADWIFSGTVGREGQNYTATVSLYRAGDGGRVSEDSYVADKLYDLVDRISADLRSHLEIPDRKDVPDLPVGEYFTSNDSALKAYGQARDFIVDNDWSSALALLQQAVTADPTFALAQQYLSSGLLLNNRSAEALVPIRAALTNVYRLPERAQFIVKSDYFAITQDLDKAFGVIEMWAELYPEDLLALQALFNVQIAKNQRVEAIATLEKIYALDSGMANVLKQIAALQSARGDFAAARDALRRYVERFPDDYTGLSSLASIELNMGELDAARRSLDKALLLEPANTNLMIGRAQLEHRAGNFTAAESGLRAALAASASARDRANAWGGLHFFYRVQGMSTPAFDALAHRIEETATFQAPLQIAALRLNNLDAYFETGRETEVRKILDEYAGQLLGGASTLAALAEVELAITSRDIPAAEAMLANVESMIEANQLEAYRSQAVTLGARLAGLKGDWERDLALRKDYLSANPTDPLVHTGMAEALRHLGRLPDAEKEVRFTLQRIPASAPGYVELARVLEARGDVAGARTAVERALTIWSRAEPDYKPAAEAKTLLETLAAR